MKQLGRLERYQRELAKLTRAKNVPSGWASPEDRCQAAIKAVGRYSQVVPLRSAAEKLRNSFLNTSGMKSKKL